jgi:pyridine nucleotide-disulfide oxidoreductase family protein
MKHLLLLGGGHAHLPVLHAQAQTPLPGTRVTLVSPFARQIYSGMVPGMVAGHYRIDDCAIALAPLAQRAKAEFVESAAVAIDAGARRVRLADGQELGYDVLSIDTGAAMDRDAIPGARENGLFVRPIEAFVRMWDALLALSEQRTLSIALIGGGAAGVELACAMQYRLGERARLCLVTGGPPPLSGYPAAVQAHAKAALRRLGVTVLEDSCVRITEQHVHLGRGTRLRCDAPVLATGVCAPPWLAESGLALDAQGFIATSATLQSTSHPEVFAAGDVASNLALQRPRSGVFAVRAGPALELNLRHFLSGGTLVEHLPKARSLNLMACGRRAAIVAWGGWSAHGRWAWYWKNWIDRKFVAKFQPQAPGDASAAAAPKGTE